MPHSHLRRKQNRDILPDMVRTYPETILLRLPAGVLAAINKAKQPAESCQDYIRALLKIDMPYAFRAPKKEKSG